MPSRLALLTLLAATALAGCSVLSSDPAPTVTVEARTTVTATATPEAEPEPEPAEPAVTSEYARPLWLGQIALEVDEDGYGMRLPTPQELLDRQLEPRPWLPDPDTDEFRASIRDVPDDVLARSSWEPGCPAGPDDLSYIQMTFWGFDQQPHTGELLIHRDRAEEVVGIFETIYDARFPIEEMRVISRAERDAPPTGDQNITSGYTCREVVGAPGVWSEHAKGLAIDINPFHNPYYKEDLTYPELAEAYKDRENERVGMIYDPSVVHDAFTDLGWTWGGDWTGREDWMHFSAEGG